MDSEWLRSSQNVLDASDLRLHLSREALDPFSCDCTSVAHYWIAPPYADVADDAALTRLPRDALAEFTACGGACGDWDSRAIFKYAQNLVLSNLISGQFRTTHYFCSENDRRGSDTTCWGSGIPSKTFQELLVARDDEIIVSGALVGIREVGDEFVFRRPRLKDFSEEDVKRKPNTTLYKGYYWERHGVVFGHDGVLLPSQPEMNIGRMANSYLKDMIRAIRDCKTAAGERAVVRKECAAIRAAVDDNDQDYSHRNIAKLMFIHMLGYPTHFGQMECLKLIASTGFPEKRIGYLGLMLLLDERQEVPMLVTNSLKHDLNHFNQYIVGLALCALGNICSVEMASDLAPEVERLLQFRDPNIRKKGFENEALKLLATMEAKKWPWMDGMSAKRSWGSKVRNGRESKNLAALCPIRIIKKVPDLAEIFINPAAALLKPDSSSAQIYVKQQSAAYNAILTADHTLVRPCSNYWNTTVMNISFSTSWLKLQVLDYCEGDGQYLDLLTYLTAYNLGPESVVKALKDIVSSPYAPEYDVSGIADPFLHIRLLKFLRIVGQGDADASERMNDILAQVATKTESNKNAGNAILYECVETIMSIEDSGGLRVLAVTILGKFLSNRDNNIRYVALNMLMKATVDTQAVQRHRATILECVKSSLIGLFTMSKVVVQVQLKLGQTRSAGRMARTRLPPSLLDIRIVTLNAKSNVRRLETGFLSPEIHNLTQKLQIQKAPKHKSRIQMLLFVKGPTGRPASCPPVIRLTEQFPEHSHGLDCKLACNSQS
ncbi:hypothetical protein TEA_017746 [Camellia sinensis var. sinensis]|uniref:Clathrin/coatomer adaptor adaptin-like N-terminal domain-containing protein n=1 Tax=Camellia sinensis var. sinensis TaxID=542762 RepID=A0A4S4EVZ6_CAMSN|nr:hypothetical protein TEA_017746 [Camellia sinensis var. sinensis]